MKTPGKLAILLLSISAASILAQSSDKKEKAGFSPGPASSFEHKQTIGSLTIAAKVIETDEDSRAPFGKLNPSEYGVLPILVVMHNTGKGALKLEDMKIEYVLPDRDKLEPTPASEVQYVISPDRPNMAPRPLPIPRPKKKNKLAVWEIEGRAWAAKMLLPGESAHGFFYFQTRHRLGTMLLISGIREAATGNEVFFFEIPLTSIAP